MKKHQLVIIFLTTLLVFTGSSVWEGAAAVSTDFPESGFYAATNAFPRNTVVDLTNLETGKVVQVIISAGLETPGLLALVSREAAEAIGLRSRTIGRIRMTLPSDPIATSRFSEGYRSGDPDYDPMAAVEGIYGKDSMQGTPADQQILPPKEEIPPPIITENPKESGKDIPMITLHENPDNPLRNDPESGWTDIPMANIPVEPEPAPAITPPPPEKTTPVSKSDPSAVSPPDYNYTLIPADERPPANYPVPQHSVPETNKAFHVFSVPAVSELERGKYYLQVGAYSQAATVESELSKIGQGYPLKVQCIGDSVKPIYRILIGPINQGESGALLKKFQNSGYKDAFVRRG